MGVVSRTTGVVRFGLVSNMVVALVALYLAVRAGGETQLGPARTDDLPYGDLVSLNRTGALLWLGAAVVALAGLLLGISPAGRSAAKAAPSQGPRVLCLVSSGLWLGLALVAAVVVLSEGDLWGMSRPGDVAVALGLALTGALAGTEAPVNRGAHRAAGGPPTGRSTD